VYVIGNHELYGAGFGTVRSILRKTSDGLANLHVLDNRSVTLGNRRFVGTTLWFPFQDDNILYEYRLNDFHLIENFGSLVYGENQRAVRYLSKTVQFGDIVVTHHLPTEESTPEQFVGGQINRFFICPLDDLIRDRRPAVWIHGHSHTSCRYRLWASWICCNPYGYFGAGANPEFESDLVIELSDEPDGSLCCK
jgi:Icc-related predicted phosphoesterase